ncbi:MAG: heparan-alpha-glucosaminide N-acetyltransferase domain-containing protein, partial [Microbacterium sp.]
MAVPRAPRLIVPDVLRGVAIVAMVLAHAAPMLPGIPHVLKSVTGNISDLASPLFALVMGMSAQLVWNAGGRVGAVLLQQAIRGVVLIALGVWMASWGSWVVIVLAFLGMLLIVGVPLLLLPTRWLAVAAGLAALVSAPVNALAREHVVPLVTSGPVIRHLAEWTVLGHSYRLTNLLPFFLLGALLLRHGLRRDRTMWGMLAIAPVAYLVRPVAERMLHVDFISGSYPDTLHDIGLVFAAYAVIVLLATPSRPRPAVDAVFVPLKAWGRVA